jgi:hypothetical protein
MEEKEPLEALDGAAQSSDLEGDRIETSEKSGDGKESQNSVPSEVSPNETPANANEPDYVTGWKLLSVLIGVTGACFLMLLDISIVATVSMIFLLFSCFTLNLRQ